jgi:DNA-binding MarR family transcriptional regulator
MSADSSNSVVSESEEHEGKAAIVLGLLTAVQDDSAVTQRSLARQLGIALGIANATFQRCVEKGLIKVREAPARRYAYYLTPHGFAEKSRLTAQYLAYSLQFFRDARDQCEALLRGCANRGWRRVVLAGAGELAEIVRLCGQESGVELLGIIDAGEAGRRFAGMPVVASLVEFGAGCVDAVIITDVRAPQATFEAVQATAAALGFAQDRILAPRLLRISPIAPAVNLEDDGVS